MSDPVLTYEGFKSWLESKDPDFEVGTCKSCSQCPISTYLVETYSKGCYTHPDYSVLMNGKEAIEVKRERWSYYFVNFVDRSRSGPKLTAKRCLGYLKSAKKDAIENHKERWNELRVTYFYTIKVKTGEIK